MEDLMTKVERVLHERFGDDARVELEQDSPTEKVGGYIVWDGFTDVEQLERQRQVWDALRSGLTADEERQVTAILTATPEEVAPVED